MNKIYFPNLNALRFTAALLVIIHHIEQFKRIYHLDSLYGESPFISSIGPQGVSLFFVLSGFLITYLLLSEEKKSLNINIPKFYIRRALRIWPLYFLVVILSLFVLPYITILNLPGYDATVTQTFLGYKLLLYIFFFANIVFAIFGLVPYCAQSWSIGTEEQFYLVWPILLKYMGGGRRKLLMFYIASFDVYLFLIH